jgi:DNA end-binding protein Ku
MAARSTWKGYLKVSLVSIPIKVYPAAESAASLAFHQLHGECRTRIQQKRWCPHCNREVANTELVKGYEFEKGRFVVVTDDDFAKVGTATTRVIDLVQFADEQELDPIYLDRAYYLAPDGPMAAGAYAVMGEAMFTLHHAAEVRGVDAIEELRTAPPELRPDEVNLARQVIGTFDAHLDLSTFHDDYRDGLRKIIDAKVAGEELVAPAVEAPQTVVNLMDALRKSLDAVSGGRKKPVKAALPPRQAAQAPAGRAADRKRKAS